MGKDEIICYHCQQSAEKYLKAFLFSHDIEPDKTHDLEYLLEICQKHNTEFSILSSSVYILNRYSVLPRYPNELEITTEDMKIAIQYAKDVQDFVLNVIK